MPELLVDFITSLDGFGAAEGWPGFWGLQGPEYMGWLAEDPEGDYTMLMGAKTYREMSVMGGENADEEATVDGASQSLQNRVLLDAASPAVVAQYPADQG
jgi:hypothetical protein